MRSNETQCNSMNCIETDHNEFRNISCNLLKLILLDARDSYYRDQMVSAQKWTTTCKNRTKTETKLAKPHLSKTGRWGGTTFVNFIQVFFHQGSLFFIRFLFFDIQTLSRLCLCESRKMLLLVGTGSQAQLGPDTPDFCRVFPFFLYFYFNF